ncbi:Uncharacterised protein [Sporosarcina pasteurii]|uniref:Uncharacterized protein n=1 Tax=Sporosarcina pasteurii TaxID=1474 RepID=A0A380C1A5_SPOPA|nr:Uncharacterised protein [Sporosarcina pasteurii]
MYIHLNKQVIQELSKNNIVHFISLWDTTENVLNFYSKQPNLYTSYKEEDCPVLPQHTPVKVFVVNDIDALKEDCSIQPSNYSSALKIL